MKKLYLFAVKRLLPVVLLCGFAGSSFSALVGSTAPSFTLKDQNNISTSLEDYRGQGVILDFCATWCPVCVKYYDPLFANELASLHGQQMFLPVLMEGHTIGTGARILSTQAVAKSWADGFNLKQVLHMSGDRDLYFELVSNYMLGLYRPDPTMVAFPTYVFIDADLKIVGNFLGLPGASNEISTWNRYVAAIENSRLQYVEQPTQVPEPATLFLTAIGLLAIALRFAKSAQHLKQATPRWGGTLTSYAPTRKWLSAN
jgi:thiol-disulfide isomerase/thioredoxin